jgi:murein DD-endopeptidase MepM/ murein hydrolase activator NlpD
MPLHPDPPPEPNASRPRHTHTRREVLALFGTAPLAALTAACLGGDDTPATVLADGTPLPTRTEDPAATQTPEATIEPVPFTPTPPASDLDPDDLFGFIVPIEGACLPSRAALMPNAPRAYRNGFHEGVDFYNGDACVEIYRGLDVRTMADGVVIRAMHDYEGITLDQVNALAQRTAEQGFTDPESLDIYRGRQVWIGHGNDVVTRYCHLESIEPSIDVGIVVRQGDVIAHIGESGTPESITAPGTEVHLHAEVRIGDSFLGSGLSEGEVRILYERLFSPE